MPACSHCEKYFSNPSQMRNHIQLEHGEEIARGMSAHGKSHDGDDDSYDKDGYDKSEDRDRDDKKSNKPVRSHHIFEDDNGKYHSVSRHSDGSLSKDEHDSHEEALEKGRRVFEEPQPQHEETHEAAERY